MDGKLSWNAEKKELWKMKSNDLMQRLQELQKDEMFQEMRSRGYTGDPYIPMSSNRMQNTHDCIVNIKQTRHKIACIKTMLNIKLNENGRTT